MRILLIQPRPKLGLGFKDMAVVEPLGLEMVAGALLPEHEVRILDLFEPGLLSQVLAEFNPHLCGISCSFTIDVYRTLLIAKQVKEWDKGTTVFVGGHHASLNPQDFFSPDIDFLVIGEGEATAREAADRLAEGGPLDDVPGLAINTGEGQRLTSRRELIRDLDRLPLPARELTREYKDLYFLGFQKPLAALETARGCPYHCTFCSVWRFYGRRCRVKSPERVVRELSRIKEEYVLVTDDNFLLDVARARRIAEEIIKSGIRRHLTIQARSDTIVKYPELIQLLKKAGVFKVFIGFEKIDEEELAAVGKQNSVANNEKALELLQKNGIGVVASFIVDPDYDRSDFARLRRYIRRFRIYTPSFSVLTPLPGTELYMKLKEKLTTTNWEFFDFMHAVLPTKLEIKEFYKELAKLYIAAYRRPEYIAKSALHLARNLLTGRTSYSHLMKLLTAARQFINPVAYMRKAGGPLPEHERG